MKKKAAHTQIFTPIKARVFAAACFFKNFQRFQKISIVYRFTSCTVHTQHTESLLIKFPEFQRAKLESHHKCTSQRLECCTSFSKNVN